MTVKSSKKLSQNRLWQNCPMLQNLAEIPSQSPNQTLGYLQNIFPQGPYQNQFNGSNQSVIYPKEIFVNELGNVNVEREKDQAILFALI